jgi:hypothetical protein
VGKKITIFATEKERITTKTPRIFSLY